MDYSFMFGVDYDDEREEEYRSDTLECQERIAETIEKIYEELKQEKKGGKK